MMKTTPYLTCAAAASVLAGCPTPSYDCSEREVVQVEDDFAQPFDPIALEATYVSDDGELALSLEAARVEGEARGARLEGLEPCDDRPIYSYDDPDVVAPVRGTLRVEWTPSMEGDEAFTLDLPLDGAYHAFEPGWYAGGPPMELDHRIELTGDAAVVLRSEDGVTFTLDSVTGTLETARTTVSFSGEAGGTILRARP
jgi:hypothetical protein